MRRVWSSFFCAGALACAVPGIVGFGADRVSEWRVAAAIARAPGLHAGRVRFRGRTVEVDDLGAIGAGWHLSVGRLILPTDGPSNPSLVTSAFARAAEATADDVVLILGDTRIVIPHVDARGTDLTSKGLAALLDPADAATLAERLAKLTAAQIAAPTVVLGSPRIPDPSTGDHFTLRNLSLTDVGEGRIGVFSAAALAFSSPHSGGGQQGAGRVAQTVLLETGRVAIDGVDLRLALDMATGSRAEAATALQPILRSLSVGGVVLRPDANTTVQVGAILAGALRGRPLTLPPSDVLTLIGRPAEARTAADAQILSDLVSDAAGSAAVDHLEVRDAVVTTGRGSPGSLKLGRAVLEGWEVVRLGSLVLEDASFSGSATDVSLDRFVVGGYDGSGLVDYFKRQLKPVPDASAAQVIPNRTSLALTGLHVAVPVTAPATGGPAADPTRRVVFDVPVASVSGGVDPTTGAVASRAAIQASYDLSAGATDPSYRDLAQYGLSRLDLGMDYAANFDPATKNVTVDHVTLDAQDFGQLAVGTVLGNASLDMFQPGQAQDEVLAATQNLTLRSFTLAFVNAGLVEKIVPPLAAAAKVSVPLFKAQMKAQAEISLDQMLGATPATAQIVTAVRTFIDTPRNLTVAVKAPSGLSFAAAAAADPKALLGAVDIQVAANR